MHAWDFRNCHTDKVMGMKIRAILLRANEVRNIHDSLSNRSLLINKRKEVGTLPLITRPFPLGYLGNEKCNNISAEDTHTPGTIT